MLDHIHILIGIKPDIALSDLVRDIKANSSRFINDKRFVRGRFSWQEGFGAFSCSHRELDFVINYIANQEEHHSKRTCRAEYEEMLKDYHVEYNKEYIFEEN